MHFLNAILYVAMGYSSLAPQNSAFEWNKKSTLSTERQVELPGIVLEPGVYIIRLRESGEQRSFIEVLNRDETQLLGTLVAVPDHRVRPDDNSDFTFYDVNLVGRGRSKVGSIPAIL